MKIGICGAQGVGKTALAIELVARLGFPLIEEVAREVLKDMGLDSPRGLKDSPKKGRVFQSLCLLKQIEAEMRHNNFVSDRTTLDNVVYWQKWHAHNASAIQNVEYNRVAREHAKSYDFLVYVPIEFPLVTDGVRSANIDYQREIDMMVQLYLQAWGNNYLTVSGSLEERVRQVMEIANGT